MTTSKIILEELKKGSKTVKELYEVLNPIKQYKNYKTADISIRCSLKWLVKSNDIEEFKEDKLKYKLKDQRTNLQKLTNLQIELGYKKGDINPIAVLGIVGESGEILNELEFGVIKTAFPNMTLMEINGFVRTAERIDTIKKEVRNKDLDIICNIKSTEEFDLEISDLFYYLNAICINRGKSIEDYAKLSFDKVTEKLKK